MKKGACFKCKKPRHMAKDHDEYEKKEEEKKKKKGKEPQKDLKAIHALISGLTKAEKEILLGMTVTEKAEEKDEEDESETEGFQ